MSDQPSTFLSELLADERWARGLARALVGDSAGDDLLQDSYLKALRQPPRPGSSVRAWFATVMRNTASSTARSGMRRHERERSFAAAERDEETPLLIRARVEQRRLLAEELLELPEAQRTALLLHFEEGLRAPEIARRLGVPEDTVRYRVKRGLERLRERLDRHHGGEREAWMRALAPLAAAGGTVGARAGLGAATLAAAGLLLAAGVSVAWWAAGRSSSVEPHADGLVASGTSEPRAVGGSLGEPGAAPGGRGVAESAGPARTPETRRLRVELVGASDTAQRVPVTIQGVAGSSIVWEHRTSVAPAAAAEFELPAGQIAALVLSAGDTGELLGNQLRVEFSLGQPPASVEFGLLERRPLRGRVVDPVGRPIGPAEAEVKLWPDRGFERVAIDAAGRFESVGRVDRAPRTFGLPAGMHLNDELLLDGHLLLAHSATSAELEQSREALSPDLADAFRRIGELRAARAGDAQPESESEGADAGLQEQLFVVAAAAELELEPSRALGEGCELALYLADPTPAERAPGELGPRFGELETVFHAANLYAVDDGSPLLRASVPANLDLELQMHRGSFSRADRIYTGLDERRRVVGGGSASAPLRFEPGTRARVYWDPPVNVRVEGAIAAGDAVVPDYEAVRVQFLQAGADPPTAAEVEVRPQSGGRFEVELADVARDTFVSAWIEGELPDGLPWVGMASGVPRDGLLELQLGPQAATSIEGRIAVRGRWSSGFGLMRVAAVPVDGRLHRVGSTPVAADGRFRLPVLEPGAYRVMATTSHPHHPGSRELARVEAPCAGLEFELDAWDSARLGLRLHAPRVELRSLRAYWRASPWVDGAGRGLEPEASDRAASESPSLRSNLSTGSVFAWRELRGLDEAFGSGETFERFTVDQLKAGLGPIDVVLRPEFADGTHGAPVLLTALTGGGEFDVELEPLVRIELVPGLRFGVCTAIDVVELGNGAGAQLDARALRDARGLPLDGPLELERGSALQARIVGGPGGVAVLGLDASGGVLERFELERPALDGAPIYLP